jgi:hypothetical protein
MLFEVVAVALSPETGDVTPPRSETINTEENSLFTDCSSPWEVEDRYEAYWNRLNACWEDSFPAGKEKVKVLSVTRI